MVEDVSDWGPDDRLATLRLQSNPPPFDSEPYLGLAIDDSEVAQQRRPVMPHFFTRSVWTSTSLGGRANPQDTLTPNPTRPSIMQRVSVQMRTWRGRKVGAGARKPRWKLPHSFNATSVLTARNTGRVVETLRYEADNMTSRQGTDAAGTTRTNRIADS
jgi:hypothetical protein